MNLKYVLLSGQLPFELNPNEESANDVVKRIFGGEINFDSNEWQKVSEEAKNCIRGLLTVDPNKRLTIDQLANHQWMKTSLKTPLLSPAILQSVGNSFNSFNPMSVFK